MILYHYYYYYYYYYIGILLSSKGLCNTGSSGSDSTNRVGLILFINLFSFYSLYTLTLTEDQALALSAAEEVRDKNMMFW